MEQQTRFPRSLKVVLAVVGIVAVCAVVYFYFVRVQDSDYTAASKQIDTMIAKATEFEGLDMTTLVPLVVTGVNLANAQQIADAYNAALDNLAKSPAITRDGEVAKVYDSVKGVVTEYGTTTANMVGTITALAPIKQKCNDFLDGIQSIRSLKALKTAETGCKEALDQYTSVPLSDYNEKYFRPYHDDLTALLETLETYYTASEGKATTQVQVAQNSISKLLKDIAALNADKTITIKNSTNPSDALRTLQAKIKQRSETAIR